jgi:hypothetical protein
MIPNIIPNEWKARATVKQYLRNTIEGDSYKPLAWGPIQINSSYAGTGTQKIFWDETGTPPSAYSMVHRLRMRNGFGMDMTYNIRVFFTDESCRHWAGMEYMDEYDPDRYFLWK